MTAQGELRGRATMGDWQEDVVEAHELADGRTMTVKRHRAETDEQWRHRLAVLAAGPDELLRLRGEHAAAVRVTPHPEYLPILGTCETCGGGVSRYVSRTGRGMVVEPWTHRAFEVDHPVTAVTFPEAGHAPA